MWVNVTRHPPGILCVLHAPAVLRCSTAEAHVLLNFESRESGPVMNVITHAVGAKTITYYDINGHNMSKKKIIFSFLYCLFYVRLTNLKWKSTFVLFFEYILWSTQKKLFFSHRFFPPPIFSPLFNFQRWKFVIEESLHTQNYQSFFRWGYGELFENIFVFSVQDFNQIWSSCAKSITGGKIYRFCFTTK